MPDVRSIREIDAALRKKGFRRDMDGPHIWYYFQNAQGEDSDIKVMMSHGAMSTTLGAPLIALMARHLHLKKKQFLALIDCGMSEESYREHLVVKGFAV